MRVELQDLAKELGELAAALESNGSRAGVALLLRHAEERLRGRVAELEAGASTTGIDLADLGKRRAMSNF